MLYHFFYQSSQESPYTYATKFDNMEQALSHLLRDISEINWIQREDITHIMQSINDRVLDWYWFLMSGNAWKFQYSLTYNKDDMHWQITIMLPAIATWKWRLVQPNKFISKL